MISDSEKKIKIGKWAEMITMKVTNQREKEKKWRKEA